MTRLSTLVKINSLESLGSTLAFALGTSLASKGDNLSRLVDNGSYTPLHSVLRSIGLQRKDNTQARSRLYRLLGEG